MVLGEFWKPENWKRFCLYRQNPRWQSETESSAGFSSLNRSRNSHSRSFWPLWWCLNNWWKGAGAISKIENMELLWLWTHNQLSYDRRECTTRFSLWNMPREHLSRTFWLWWWPVKEWWSKSVRNFLKRELGMFLLVALKPGVIETNRGHGWI